MALLATPRRAALGRADTRRSRLVVSDVARRPSRRDARSRARPRVEHRAARPSRVEPPPERGASPARRRGPARDAQLLAPRARSLSPSDADDDLGTPGAPLRARDPAAAAAPPPSASPPARRGALARVVGSVGIITLACKLLGLLREGRVAAAFGVGPIADAHALACVVPTFFFVAVGGLSGPPRRPDRHLREAERRAECASREGERRVRTAGRARRVGTEDQLGRSRWTRPRRRLRLRRRRRRHRRDARVRVRRRAHLRARRRVRRTRRAGPRRGHAPPRRGGSE